MGRWLEIYCPGCKSKKSVSPGSTYKTCDRCGTPHCQMELGFCKVEGCNGSLREEKNDE